MLATGRISVFSGWWCELIREGGVRSARILRAGAPPLSPNTGRGSKDASSPAGTDQRLGVVQELATSGPGGVARAVSPKNSSFTQHLLPISKTSQRFEPYRPSGKAVCGKRWRVKDGRLTMLRFGCSSGLMQPWARMPALPGACKKLRCAHRGLRGLRFAVSAVTCWNPLFQKLHRALRGSRVALGGADLLPIRERHRQRLVRHVPDDR